MKRPLAFIFTIVIAAACAGTTLADGDLLARMSAVNPDLHSYTAQLHAHVALTSFPFIATDLAGTYYHKDPDLDKLDITSGLPGMAKQFSKLYPHIEPAARWKTVFDVSVASQTDSQTVFKLMPRKHGNVDHIDATVDNKTATVSAMRWNYNNGGWATMNNTYSSIDGHVVISAQSGHVEEPSYKGNITSTLDQYVFNPKLSDDLFKDQ
jgi:hypothetical protein